MILFLSGPISGDIRKNRRAFHRAERAIRRRDRKSGKAFCALHKLVILNPARLPLGMEHEQYIRICKSMIDECACIVQLPGWRDSTGAVTEARYADSKGKLCVRLEELTR